MTSFTNFIKVNFGCKNIFESAPKSASPAILHIIGAFLAKKEQLDRLKKEVSFAVL